MGNLAGLESFDLNSEEKMAELSDTLEDIKECDTEDGKELFKEKMVQDVAAMMAQVEAKCQEMQKNIEEKTNNLNKPE